MPLVKFLKPARFSPYFYGYNPGDIATILNPDHVEDLLKLGVIELVEKPKKVTRGRKKKDA